MTEKKAKTTKTIVMEIGEDVLRFKVGPQDYRQFIDEVSECKKTVPMQRLLQRTIIPDDIGKLEKYIDFRFAELAGLLVGELTGEQEVIVKK